MSKPRLFVFGDSWAFNYFSKNHRKYKPHFGSQHIKKYAEVYNHFGHWIDHMENFYDVYSYGVGAATNEEIIHQIGNLNNYSYTQGDRVIVIFTTPERLNIINNKKMYGIASAGLLYKSLYKDSGVIKFIENQFIERYDRWMDTSIQKNEKLLIKLLHKLLSKWNPIFYTWTDLLDIDEVIYKDIDFKKYSISAESNGVCSDWHLGVEGNYKLFKLFADWLGIDISNYSYVPAKFKVDII